MFETHVECFGEGDSLSFVGRAEFNSSCKPLSRNRRNS